MSEPHPAPQLGAVPEEERRAVCLGLDAGGLLMFEAHVKFEGRDSGERGARIRYRDINSLGDHHLFPSSFFSQAGASIWRSSAVHCGELLAFIHSLGTASSCLVLEPHTQRQSPLDQDFGCERTGLTSSSSNSFSVRMALNVSSPWPHPAQTGNKEEFLLYFPHFILLPVYFEVSHDRDLWFFFIGIKKDVLEVFFESLLILEYTSNKRLQESL